MTWKTCVRCEHLSARRNVNCVCGCHPVNMSEESNKRFDHIRTRQKALRAEAIRHYGGECVCCGESEPIFLDFDHVNNDGSVHRRQDGANMMYWLRRNGYPPTIQLLCANCNQGKRRNGGICPHLDSKGEPLSNNLD